MLHLGAEGDVAVGVAKIGQLLLHGGRIGERKIAMPAHQRQPLDMRQFLPLDLGRGALEQVVEIDAQGGHGRESACRLWRDVPFDTLDAPRRPDFSREAENRLRFRIPASVTRSASPRSSNQSHCRDLIIADAADMPYRAAWFRTEAGIPLHVVVLAAFLRWKLFPQGGAMLWSASAARRGVAAIGTDPLHGFARDQTVTASCEPFGCCDG